MYKRQTQDSPDDYDTEYDAVCTYKEQSENMLDDDPDYPFYLTTGRVAHYHHTTPVSYTHLDVYKRQPLHRTSRCPFPTKARCLRRRTVS